MPAAETAIRAVTEDDLDTVAAIFGHYVVTSVVTFETSPPTVEHWRSLRNDLASRGLPFLACEHAGQVVRLWLHRGGTAAQGRPQAWPPDRHPSVAARPDRTQRRSATTPRHADSVS